jgi:peroxiredoxin Q/BCP
MHARLFALLLALAAPFGMVATASAQSVEQVEYGPAIGAKAPAVSVVTADGAPATLDSLKGQKGLVLAFVRSADWCPFCKSQLKDLNTVAADLKAAGYPLVALSYDPPATLKTFGEKNSIAYTLVSDEGSKVINAYGLRNTAMDGKKRFEGVPHPMILVIGSDGLIQAKLYEQSYQKRPAAGLVLQTVQALK